MNTIQDANASALDRFLRLFTDVRPGEAYTALVLTANIFLILTAYYVLKPVREALILAGDGGAEIKSYAAAGQAMLLLLAIPLYGKLASSVSRRKLINVVTVFFCLCLVAFYVLATAGAPVAVVFFLWVGIFNLMVPAQFWSLANDVYTPEAGKRLFVIVAFGASAGAVFGSYLSGHLIDVVGVYQLLIISSAILGSSLLLTNWVESRERPADSAKAAKQEAPLDKSGAFQLVVKTRYLLLIALLVLFLNWVNSTGEYILGRAVKEAAEAAIGAGPEHDAAIATFIGHFYADYFAVVNIAGLLLQLFVVSRILKYFGVRFAIFALPIIALGGYILIAFYPILSWIRAIKTAENAADYSLQNTVHQILFLPTSREAKYKAKQAIDTFFYRAGDVFSAGLVYIGTAIFALTTMQFALVNIALVSVWLTLAFLVGRENKTLLERSKT